MERIKKIINHKNVGNAFYNLVFYSIIYYNRWRDEEEFEDINEYGKAILNTIHKHFPDYNVKLIEATKKPFGVKLDVDGIKAHLFAKIKGGYLCVCAKLI